MARGKNPHYVQPSIKSSHVGRLRAESHAKDGHDIPEKSLEKDKHSKSPELRREATFAENARGWNHSK
jgi:hypothetical protein